MGRRSMRIVTAGLAVAVIGIAGCGSSSGGHSGGGAGGTVTLGSGGVFTLNNNPFVPTSSAAANGWAWLIYEPLVQTNAAVSTQQPKPWLASAYKWAADYKSVQFTARSGVKWNDGKPFSAADIAYTFGLLKSNAALNSNSLPIAAVKQNGDNVTVDFSTSQFASQAKVDGQFIVPQHVWRTVPNPTKFADKNPVGTGPFTFKSTTSSVAKLDRNPSYWQASKVKPSQVVYQALQGNDAILNALAAHTIDWASSFALNQKSGFTDKSSKNIAWNVAELSVSAFMLNTAKPPFNDVNLRRAMSLAIDSNQATKLSTGGLWKPVTSVTGLPQPIGDSFISATFHGKDIKPDVSAANAALKAGGYKLSGGVLTNPQGKPVKMTLVDPAGWTDYLTDLQVIGQDLKKLGIATTIQTPSQDAWYAALTSGHFDGTMLYSNSGATPYDLYATYMNGADYKPIGTTASGDLGRFNNAAATKALQTYASAASDADRKAALDKIQSIWADQVPAISMISKGDTGMFTTENWTGWPTQQNPYASPGLTNENISLVMTSLQPAQ